MSDALLHHLAVALGLGLIVGFERGWKTREAHGGRRPAGIRTFALAGLAGGVLASFGMPYTLVVLAAGLLVLGALTARAYSLTAAETKDFGLTTELALLTTFGLGAMAVAGYPMPAVAAAVVMSALLGYKAEVHHLIADLDRRELLATLQLLLVAVVLVPVLPARDMGPWQAINPRLIGWLVLLIAGLSYVGYFGVKLLGARLGLLLTAVVGGLTSSTAVAVAYARRARERAAPAALLGTGIALAAATMVPRVAVEIATVNAPLLGGLWPTLVVLALVPIAGVVFAVKHASPADTHPWLELDNPLELRAALIFGVVLSAIFVIAEGAERALGSAGVYATSLLAGLADVDAITLTLAHAAGRSIETSVAERALVVALLTNTAVKAALAATIGGIPMLRWASSTLAIALVAAAVAAMLTL